MTHQILSEMNTLMENWFLKQKQVSGWLCVLNTLRDEYINGKLVPQAKTGQCSGWLFVLNSLFSIV